MLLRALLTCLLCSSALPAQFSIENSLSSAFPWEMVSAPKANRVAWVTSWNGPWNIWVAEAPAYAGRQLTNYRNDDGQEISQLAWSPDGQRLLFVRGGSANPASDVRGAEQSVWLLEISGGAPRRLGDGSSPLVSPDGLRALWLKGGTVWSVEFSAGSKPAPLFKARGNASGLAFSPDGTKLAFSSSRSDHAFIGVYELSAKAITWLDPSTDRDILPAWSPNGKSIAFLRIVSEQPPPPHGARRAATPWSIRVADLATGAAREVFRAEAGKGSVFQPVASGPSLYWAKSASLVFPWERSGWKLLYAVPAAGGSARVLTPGEFEVQHVEPSADGASLLIDSNQSDIDRRHLWRVDVDSGRVTRAHQGRRHRMVAVRAGRRLGGAAPFRRPQAGPRRAARGLRRDEGPSPRRRAR